MSPAVLAGLVIAAIVVLAVTATTTSLVFALVSVIAATGLAMLAVRGMLADLDRAAAERGAWASAVALAVVMIAAVVATAVVAHDDAASDRTAMPDAAGAAQAVRYFLTAAVVDDTPYYACEYLTAARAPAGRSRGARADLP